MDTPVSLPDPVAQVYLFLSHMPGTHYLGRGDLTRRVSSSLKLDGGDNEASTKSSRDDPS